MLIAVVNEFGDSTPQLFSLDLSGIILYLILSATKIIYRNVMLRQ